MTDKVASEEQKSEAIQRARKKCKFSLITVILFFMADAISWTAFIGFHAAASLPGAIAFSGVFIMYATLAYTACREYMRLLAE